MTGANRDTEEMNGLQDVFIKRLRVLAPFISVSWGVFISGLYWRTPLTTGYRIRLWRHH